MSLQEKLLDIPLGLVINFHELKLTDGLVRMILPGLALQKITKETKEAEARSLFLAVKDGLLFH